MNDDGYTDLEPPGFDELDPLRQLLVEELAKLPDEALPMLLAVWRVMVLTGRPTLYLN